MTTLSLRESYSAPDTSVPILDSTVGGVLRQAASTWPEAVALVAGMST